MQLPVSTRKQLQSLEGLVLTASLLRVNRPSTSVHPSLGTAVFVIVLVQAASGILAKFLKRPDFPAITLQRKRHPLRYLHILLGIATLALLCKGTASSLTQLRELIGHNLSDAQVYTGYQYWNQSSPTYSVVPRGIIIAFWVLFAVEVFAYLLGWPVMETLARKSKSNTTAREDMKEARTNSDNPLLTP